MHTARINRIATDASGRWAVTASYDKTARIWEVASGRLLQVLRPPQDAGNEGRISAVAMSPDGQTVAAAGWTGWDWDGKTSIYLFDRASGRLRQRLPGLSSVASHMTYSRDGRRLAATLGDGSLHVFDAQHGHRAAGQSIDCRNNSYSADFSADGRRLLTSCFDGRLRVYAVAPDGTLGPPKRERPGGGQRPFAARFSPDGQRIAVGFQDSTVVQILDAATLAEVARPSTAGAANGDLGSVAWSANGRSLIAGGTWDVGGKNPVRRWLLADPSRPVDLPLTDTTLMDFAPLPGGGWLFAAADPAWGVLNAAGQLRHRQDPPIADLRGPQRLRLSADGRRVRFSLQERPELPRSFDVASRTSGADDAQLAPARTEETPGLVVRMWQDDRAPTLNGQPIVLDALEMSRSLAISADGQRFVLGSDWALRLIAKDGRIVWRRAVPGVVWAVNLSADQRFVVAAYGDGTIRWHRVDNGNEILALLPHRDGQRWVAWTPEGFYAASGADAEEWMGYHLNRGRDREGEFVSARQLREAFYDPELISRRLDTDGNSLLAQRVVRVGNVGALLAGARAPPPQVELLSSASVRSEGEVPVKVKVSDRGGGVGRVIYRIDGVEVEGRPVDIGVAADGSASRSFPLAPGRQREITISATNARGVESVPVRVLAEVTRPQALAPALHVLAVGVTQYRDNELRRGVRFAAGDAKAVRDLFERQGRRLFGRVNAQLLDDERATGDAIRAKLAEMAANVAPQDVFVLYLAGHGMSIDRQYHFIPWDAVYTSATALLQRSVTHQQFSGLLAKLAATKTLVLLDTCSSGAFGREPGRSLGDKDALDRLSRLTGRALISASADDKIALEGVAGHGAFTYVLLQGLGGAADRDGNGTVEVRELADYIEAELPKITAKRIGQEQYPFSSTEGHTFPLLRKP